ncbi:bifunctional riboflavin kinase/FAD synthetase [Parahaliea sp. F7430]|uniref:Riboflavin biosynthesis protein n=1 Tax=Sediminihaliea albiluteola TaxID=2758564 RepID=A0A7W2YL15_9GAMM|nr:bifunctional riboflavin kinase/FAD synthetase [Sediminihaliea albiluteola]MBA6414304.1 bifunctional riboflavin kinase/FAD synthetase [Sediminihaliea albiluteola]
MELIRGLHNLQPRHRGCVATIGAFDGVHLGHQAVIRHLLEKARELGLPSVVIVFEPLPREYLTPLAAPARLMSFREKFAALSDMGVERVLRIRFSEQLRNKSAQSFVDEVFVEGLGVRYIVLGDDFRFGNDRQGDAEFIKAQGPRNNYQAGATETLEFDGERVSSTRIRKALEEADFELAEALLSRPYSIAGKVVYGRQLGGQLGFPTANLQLHRLRAALSGVFVVSVEGPGLAGAKGVANVGTRPTVDESIKANLEVHLLDIDVNLYGKHIKVTFLHKLREEQKFASVEQLREQIAKDITTAREWFAGQD